MGSLDGLDDEARTTYYIGMVARESARMEYTACALLAALLDNPPAGNVVAFGQSFSAVTDMVAAIVKSPNAHMLRRPDLNDSIRDAVVDARGAWEERNEVVHGVWMLPTVATSIRVRRHNRIEQRTFTHADLEAVIARVSGAADALRDLNNELAMGHS